MVEPVQIGLATLYLGDALAIMPEIGAVDHIICDPPYEKSLHDSKNSLARRLRNDRGPELQWLVYRLLHRRGHVGMGEDNQRKPHEIQACLRMGEA